MSVFSLVCLQNLISGYVGQLLLIKNLLSSEFVVVLSESDESILNNVDEEGLGRLPTVENTNLKRVRVATVSLKDPFSYHKGGLIPGRGSTLYYCFSCTIVWAKYRIPKITESHQCNAYSCKTRHGYIWK
jgi:hypothetical protein